MKRYTNFDEIDRDLKFLRLKAKIDLEEVKLGVNDGKRNIMETLSPVNLIANTLGSIIKKTFVLKVVDKLIGIKPVKKANYEDRKHL
jgi:hypothetical protein